MRFASKLFLFLVFCFTFGSFANPTSQELWENVQFVHLTSYLADHTVVPGSSMRVSTSQEVIKGIFDSKNPSVFPFRIEPQGPNQFALFDVKGVNPERRMTSHWTVFEPVRNFEADPKDKILSDWDYADIAIIEPAKYFKGQLFGGFHQDMMVIGPHVLSEEAYIFAPARMREKILRQNPNFRGRYWFYGEEVKNGRHAVELFNRKAPMEFLLGTTRSQNLDKFFDEREKRWEMRWVKPANQQDPEELALSFLAAGMVSVKDDVDEVRETHLAPIEKLVSANSSQAIHKMREFVDLFESFAETSHLFLNGRLKKSQDVFSSWIEEGIYWGHHKNSGFRELENLMTATFTEMAGFNLVEEALKAKALLENRPKQNNPKKPCKISKQELESNAIKIDAQFRLIHQSAKHMSKTSRDYIAAHAGNIAKRVKELRAFCNY